VLAFSPDDGWRLYAGSPTEEERVWLGDTPGPDRLGAWTGLARVHPLPELAAWLSRRRDRPLAILGNRDLLDRPESYGLPDLPRLWLSESAPLTARLSEQVSAARRVKDEAELAVMRRAASATRAGHLAAMRTARTGITEWDLKTEIEAEFFRHGSRRPAYDTLVGAGRASAVLHCSPGDRPLRQGDLVLVDAGAEVGGYMGDVTRVLPASGTYSDLQRDVYQLVLSVEAAAIARCRPGAEFRELHLLACVELARGLVDLGVLRGDPESLVERDAHALFFPHGLGHLLGIVTHDAGGYLPGRVPSDRFGLKWLRTDLPLEPGIAVTVEPGIYFIPALLQSASWRERFREEVDWDRVDGLLDFGGIRIEDDVVVTETAPEVLTAGIPKHPADVEVQMESAGE
jgi:Xaa-Pro aminopeptidase